MDEKNTVKEIQAALKFLGISFKAKATKRELLSLLPKASVTVPVVTFPDGVNPDAKQQILRKIQKMGKFNRYGHKVSGSPRALTKARHYGRAIQKMAQKHGVPLLKIS